MNVANWRLSLGGDIIDKPLGGFCWLSSQTANIRKNENLAKGFFMDTIMQNLISTTVLTMTSREIADLVELRHDNVKRTIDRLASQGHISDPQVEEYLDSLNRPALEFKINKRDSYVIVAQLSPAFTARLVDRWQELEQGNQIKVPQTLPEALRLAADLADKVQEQQLLIEQQQPAVEFLGRYVEAKNTKGIREVGKVLGAKEKEFKEWLLESNYLFRQGGTLLPYAHYQHAGWFEVKTGEANGHAFQQTKFTPEGIAAIAKHWARRA